MNLVGNRQYISRDNLAENRRVCLFLIDYPHRQRTSIWGTAEIVPLDDTLGLPVPKKGRPEQIVILTVTRWDINCPQGIPVKLDAQDVAAAVTRLEARIVELEAENARLRAV